MTLTTALVARDPWSVVPSLGNLDAYIRAVQAIPLLEADEEQRLARRLRDEQDVQAASRLVLSHLRLVVSITRQYLGYGLSQSDLIQEGNVGLMKAVKRFDPDQGVRLVSYAVHWIKAEIHEYILRNWRMVKVATTKAQRKLFFNLRSLKHSFKGEADDAHVGRAAFSEAEVHRVAQELDVRPEDVVEMEMRLAGADVALEAPADDDGEGPAAPAAYLADDAHEPTRMIDARHRDWLASDGIRHALSTLDDRSRRIVETRWLSVNDDGSGGLTLHDLAAEYGVSAERIRQIETAAMKKMRKALSEAARLGEPIEA
ncbi:RNA polymerase sigma factor RpoH [Aquabacterium fontiphilum]|uniref:RNA polymerase sigma factor RpoH n=1 Tax=Aquabacterium fontiphilum TaxID=450365 RepID=UPI00137843A4|nr:RNA polymerase sigma factor RpoH [Aquabacterium fontiphilum]NBD20379.1 RNA polymerase sigma factor RpoH [Aquabacterium fontiphilum]